MATQSWSTVIDHTSDAGFRAWGSELSAKLSAAGLVQAADTGQINWSTVTRPGTNTAGGYEIRYLNDSLHATAPIYLKLEYGTGSSGAVPVVWITVGTGSNGSGTITGQASSRVATAGGASSIASTSTPYQSYLCVSEGFVGLLLKSLATGVYPVAFFALERTRDGTGAITNIGFRLHYGDSNGTSHVQCVRTAATAQTMAATDTWGGFVVGGVTNSDDGAGNKQVYLHYGNFPKLLPALGTATIVAAELAVGNTMSSTLIGATAHTYISIGSQIKGDLRANSTTYGLVMLWE